MSKEIVFTSSKEQLIEIALAAINASRPMGMGYLHHKAVDYTPEDFLKAYPVFDKDPNPRAVHIDYFEGRMVKLSIMPKREDGEVVPGAYRVRNELSLDYQSFGAKYADMKALLDTVPGVEIVSMDGYE